MRNLRLRIISVFLAVVGVFALMSISPAFVHPAFAENPDDAPSEEDDGGGGGGGSSVDQAKQGIRDAGGTGGPSLETIVRNIANILSWIVGVAAVVMIVIAGLKYITSGGDAGGIQSAKNTLIYAIVGLLIAIFAQIIINFVIRKATTSSGNSSYLIQTMIFS